MASEDDIIISLVNIFQSLKFYDRFYVEVSACVCIELGAYCREQTDWETTWLCIH